MAIIKNYGNVKVVIDSLTFGYLLDIESNKVEETELGLILDATDLTEGVLRKLTRTNVTEIVELITQQTYPELFDENGNRIVSDNDIIESEDKKKA